MKTVSAHIISSNPVSLSRAAKFLSNFVQYDNGSSNAIITYLQRTSDAFNELSEFHKKLKTSGPNRKSNSSKASFGISASYNEPSMVSAWSSEGEKVTEKRKDKNRTKEVDGDLSVSIRGTGVDGSKSVIRHTHGEASGNDFEGNVANGVEDNHEAITEKKRKEKHKQKDQVDGSNENGAGARERDGVSDSRYSVSQGSEGNGSDLWDKSGEKKRRKKKKKKGEEGDNGLPPNNIRTEEKEISDGKLGSEECKKESSKKRKNEEIQADGAVEHSRKKTKRRVGTDQDL